MRRLWGMTGLFAALLLLLAPTVRAQSTSAEQLAAARELVSAMNATEQFKAMMPMIIKALKPAIVQGRSDVERDYDAAMPAAVDLFQKRFDELETAVVVVYANNFSVGDLRALTKFYKSPTGQRLLEKMPVLTQQTLAAGQKFGQSVGMEMRQRMIDDLRKRGRDL